VLGKSQVRVQQALEAMRQRLPFALLGIDTDNGSEFLNAHLVRYCRGLDVQFTRGRPYKKDDNAHIEQKNWTHVRKLVGYERYDTEAAVAALNALYRELRLLQNLFLPTVKLVRKERVGARVRRIYDAPQTPLDRVRACPTAEAPAVAKLVALRAPARPRRAGGAHRPLARAVYALAHRRACRGGSAGPWTVPDLWTPSTRPRGRWTPAKSAGAHTAHRHHHQPVFR